MAINFSQSLRRDYLAKEFLIEMLQDPGVVVRFLNNDEAKLVDPNVADDIAWFDDLLVSRCVGLADKLLSELRKNKEFHISMSPIDNLQGFPDPSPLVLDGDLS